MPKPTKPKAVRGLVKRCPCCESEKPIERFYREYSRKDGRSCYCKDCMKIKYKKLDWSRYTKIRRLMEPMKEQARQKLQQAVYKKEIHREDCFFCGNKKTEAHHLLYDFPFKVIWVCIKHHKEIHYQKKFITPIKERGKE